MIINPVKKYNTRADKIDSLLCVGLDSNINRLPDRFQKEKHPQFAFNKWIIDQTHPFTAAYKPNIAFYEARGAAGWQELAMTMKYLQKNYPDIFTICDAKRADIGSTNDAYVTAIFDDLGFDAITLHPFLGKKALQPFLKRKDKISIILCKTSNEGSGEFQDLMVQNINETTNNGTHPSPLTKHPNNNSISLYEYIATQVKNNWNENNNCMLVVGATYPVELAKIRAIVGDMTILIPGIGAQGGNIKNTVEAGLNSKKKGIIINSSRGIIFAGNPELEAQKLRDEIENLLDNCL